MMSGIFRAALLCGILGCVQTNSIAQSSPAGVRITELKIGAGTELRQGRHASVHLEAWRVSDGRSQLVESTKRAGRRLEFLLGKGTVVPGLEEGVDGMRVGGKRRLLVPPELAYGESGAFGKLVPPNSSLVMDVELFDVY